MAYQYELTKLSNTHNSIAEWLIANPGKGQLGKCAAHFDYTNAWLSTLMGTDAFRALLRHKQGEQYEEILVPLKEKITGVAHASLDKLGEVVQQTSDARLIKDIAKDTLGMLGYGTGAVAVNINNNNTENHLHVNPDALAAARQKRLNQYSGGETLEGTSKPEDAKPQIEAQRVSTDSLVGLGETRDVRAGLSPGPEETQGSKKAGSGL